jgi:hypothetical protein
MTSKPKGWKFRNLTAHREAEEPASGSAALLGAGVARRIGIEVSAMPSSSGGV